jgi:hypothetical protein
MAISISEFPGFDPKRAVSGLLAAAGERTRAAGSVPASCLEDHELTEALAAAAALEAQAASVKLALVAEADARDVAAREGLADTAAWAARLIGTNRGVMAGGLRLVRLLGERYDATRRAFAAGRINEKQMRVIVNAAEKIPAGVTPEQRVRAEEGLLAKAEAGMAPERLRHAGRRMLEVIDRELADACEADQLSGEEQRAQTQTWLTLHDQGDGTVVGKFQIPEQSAAFLKTMLERLSAPRRLGRNQAGEPIVDPTAPGHSYTERLGMAFCELLEHLPSTGWGPANGATLLVTMDYQHLLDGLAAAHLDTGIAVSAHNARRLSCEAGIVSAVLGGRSEPLDVGREMRLHTAAQRRGLALLYDTCAAEGCTRPFAWCEIHHPHAWADGGQTSLANGIPLCGWHHHRAHDPTYHIRYLDTGEVRFRHKQTRPWQTAA